MPSAVSTSQCGWASAKRITLVVGVSNSIRFGWAFEFDYQAAFFVTGNLNRAYEGTKIGERRNRAKPQ
jgi:hypothetical protein